MRLVFNHANVIALLLFDFVLLHIEYIGVIGRFFFVRALVRVNLLFFDLAILAGLLNEWLMG